MSIFDTTEISAELASLTVFRQLLSDTVISSLLKFLNGDEHSVSDYCSFVSKLYELGDGNLSLYIENLCYNCENIYVKEIGKGKTPPKVIEESTIRELKILTRITEIDAQGLADKTKYPEILPKFYSEKVDLVQKYLYRASNIGKFGYGKYAANRMFSIDDNGVIIPVKYADPIRLSELIDYETEREKIIDNTKALLAGKPAANILLTGDAGTGKSSTVKAIGNEFFSEGLRIIEIRKDQLDSIPKILDELASNPLKFILFIDDLSFLSDDDHFNGLKAVLEGSVSARSSNVVIYATSNRRHIIRERFSDREGDEIHRNDTMQEIVSLSERFGLHVSFQKPSKQTFLHIVNSLAAAAGIEKSEEELALAAERFALERGGRSARLARQFVDSLIAKN